MKIECELCEKVEAEVLCCADEAVLCRGCDEKVHAANKLSQKHQRLLLLNNPSSTSSSSHPQLPPCDICQERNGQFFCLEDRALFCRNCDVSTHMGSPLASSHQRFLITGVKVALEANSINNNADVSFNTTNSTSPNSTTSFNFPADNDSSWAAMTMNKVDAASTETRPEPQYFATGPNNWLLNHEMLFDSTKDFNCYDFSEVGSSRISSP